MSNCNVTLYWAVPEKVWDKEIVSLTGSATVLNLVWKKILIDLWLFQWWEWSDLYNKENIKFLNEIDAVIITHSHIDHIWRLPLLYKLWYRKPIYMTEATKDITFLMLLDSLKIQEWDIEINKSKNEKLGFRLKKSLNLKNELKIKKKLNEEEKKILKELEEYLEFYWVKEENDIKNVISKLSETLFELEDIDWVMSLIKTVKYNEEITFDSKIISSKNNNTENQDLLNNLPRKISEWFEWKIGINTYSERSDLKKKWVVELINEVKNILNSTLISNNNNINAGLKKELEKALIFNSNYYPWYRNWNTWVHKNDENWYQKEFEKNEKLLKFYDIKDNDGIERLYIIIKDFVEEINKKEAVEIIGNDIDNTINSLEKLIKILNLTPSFNTKHIKEALSKIYVLKKKNKERNSIGILFSDVAHLVWSASVTLTTNIKNKVKNIIDVKSDSISVFFSGDMWRINDNRLWRPEIPKKPVNYLQIESTYWGKVSFDRETIVVEMIELINWENELSRNGLVNKLVELINWKTHIPKDDLENKLEELIKSKNEKSIEELSNELNKILNVKGHRNRWESVKDLIDSIEKSEWNVLISVFSQQRLQEILLTILEEKIKRWVDFLDYEILIDAPLGKDVTDTYLNYKPELYNLLSEKWQIEAFGRVVFRFLKIDEWQNIYTFTTTPKKNIILASSWMMSWWAIMNHLPHILADKKATILAPGYLSKWTLWNEIVWWGKKMVTVPWVGSYEIECNKKYIEGFSSHIWHDEILQYLTEAINAWILKQWATIALSHWNIEWQQELKTDIENILKELKREDIMVSIPWLFDEYDIVTKKVNDIKSNEKLVVKEKIHYKKPVVPRIIQEIEKKEEDIKKETIPQVVIEERTRNANELKKIKIKRDIISKRKEEFEENYLIGLLNNSWISSVNEITSEISNLSVIQRDKFYESINSKINRNRAIESNMKNLFYNIWEVEKFKNNIIIFFSIGKQEIISEINQKEKDLRLNEEEIYKLKSRLLELEDKLSELPKNGWNLSDEDKKILKDLQKSIQWKNKKKIAIELKIKALNKKIVEEQKYLYRDLKSLIPQCYYEEFDNIYKEFVLKYTNGLYKKLNNLFEKIIDDFKQSNKKWEQELKSHIVLEFKVAEPSFQWKDLYEELLDSELYDKIKLLENKLEKATKKLSKFKKDNKNETQENIEELKLFETKVTSIKKEIKEKKDKYLYQPEKELDINLKKLEKLIKKSFFSKDELIKINSYLSVIQSSDSNKKKKLIAKNNLISYLKNQRDKNRNLWININFSIDELNKEVLLVLSKIFEAEYFNNEIKDKFDIYSFLKSKKSLKEYISEKYIIKNLKDISDELIKFGKKSDKMDYLLRILDWIEKSNNNSLSIEELSDLNFVIYSTKMEVEDLTWSIV